MNIQAVDKSELILNEIVNYRLPVVVWGLGGMISFISDNIKEFGIKIDYIVDNNPNKWNRCFEDIPIVSFSEIKEICPDAIILLGIVTPKKVIQRDKPILAICIYHCIEDHWQIPLLVNEIYDGYDIYIRHYHYMGIETVMYAIPNN